jgi:TonB family C-terminal domain
LIQWYLGLIQQKIEEAKVYPEKARRNNQEGKVLVEFSILSGGMLKKATIIDSSKRRLLDRAALDTIGRAAPFSPIPTSLKMNEMTIRMPIVFDLE